MDLSKEHTYTNEDGFSLPVPPISEALMAYLAYIAPMSRYKELQNDVQLHNMHGQMKIIDHLGSLYVSQNRTKD